MTTKLPGVPHMDNKLIDGGPVMGGPSGIPKGLAAAPRARQNALNVRIAPLKRLVPAIPAVKPDKFGFTE